MAKNVGTDDYLQISSGLICREIWLLGNKQKKA